MSSDRRQASVGVLAMAYGTPAETQQLEAYYTHIRHGHRPSPELLEELRRRYQAIGGLSPLLEHTRTQVQGLQAALHARVPGCFCTVLGMKHAPPFLEDGVAALVQRGVRRIVGLVLAPHYSTMSVGEYMQRAQAVCPSAVPFSAITSWHLRPGYLAYLTEQILRVRARMEARTGVGAQDIHVLFTAHSLPTRILEVGDPYPGQLHETAEAVAQLARLTHWSVAWQSAGRTAEAWIGPSILEVLPELAAQGVKGVVVCPAGFVSEHLEVLYDLDIEASQLAARQHLAFARTEMPDRDARFFAMLAELVLHQDGQSSV